MTTQIEKTPSVKPSIPEKIGGFFENHPTLQKITKCALTVLCAVSITLDLCAIPLSFILPFLLPTGFILGGVLMIPMLLAKMVITGAGIATALAGKFALNRARILHLEYQFRQNG